MDTVFVDSLEQLPEMQKVLEASTCVTLDVEWRPNSFTPRTYTVSTPVATAELSAEQIPSGAGTPRSPLADTDGTFPTLSESALLCTCIHVGTP